MPSKRSVLSFKASSVSVDSSADTDADAVMSSLKTLDVTEEGAPNHKCSSPGPSDVAVRCAGLELGSNGELVQESYMYIYIY